jgi:hypothetical protein
MEAITFLIAAAALILSILAYRRTGAGGTAELRRRIESKTSSVDLKKEMDALMAMADGFREKTADALDRLEKVLRKTERGQS